jgi:hypothetical protein
VAKRKRQSRSAKTKERSPGVEAREALAMWGLALRYAKSAAAPSASHAVEAIKERVPKARLATWALARLKPKGAAATWALARLKPEGAADEDAEPEAEDAEGAMTAEGDEEAPQTKSEEEPAESEEEPGTGPTDEGPEEPREAEVPAGESHSADALDSDFDHAYSEDVENYEHRDAYAPIT